MDSTTNCVPNDAILLLTGVPCIGKTTTAYEIIRRFTAFQRVVEMDIVSDTVRTVLKQKLLEKASSALFESITVQPLDVTKEQAKILLPYVKELVLRQQKRRIPTILEGAEIIPSLFFKGGQPAEWLNERVIFIHLYLSDEEQRKRRLNRFIERKYPLEYNEIIRQEALVLKEKNEKLREESLTLSKNFPNVFNVDISHSTPEKSAEKILQTVENYFQKLH